MKHHKPIFKWEILDIERKNYGLLAKNRVKRVVWQVSSLEDLVYPISMRMSDEIVFEDLTEVMPKNFTKYTSLNEDIVVGWVKKALGEDTVSQIEKNLENLLIENKGDTMRGLPW
jgi:hypothetical protein